MINETIRRLLLTPHEAAQALSISERTLWQLSKDCYIPVVKIGRAVRYAISDLERFIEAQKTAGRQGPVSS